MSDSATALSDAATGRREAHAALAELLGARAFTAPLPEVFAEAPVQARRILAAEAAHAYAPAARRLGEATPGALAALVAEGTAVTATEYLTALDWRGVLSAGIGTVLERADAVAFVDGAGLPAFLGMPTVTLPLLQGEDGRGIGVHLAARRGEDARLVRTAAWLAATTLELESAA